MGGAIPVHCEIKMGGSIGLSDLGQEGRVELAIRDLRGLMRGWLERILSAAPNMKIQGWNQ